MINTDKSITEKKSKKVKNAFRFIVLLICLISICGIPAAAYTTYTTYIYTFDDFAVESPDAYVPEDVIDSEYINRITQEKHQIGDFLEGEDLDGPQDLFIDIDGFVYLADQKKDRIVILNPDYSGKFILKSFVNMWGVPDGLSQPKGVFATEDEIYVADTEKNRIVVFSKGTTLKPDGEPYFFGEHIRIIEQPSSDVFPEGHVYKPITLVVDKAGRIYVVSSTTNQGIISMSPDGEF